LRMNQNFSKKRGKTGHSVEFEFNVENANRFVKFGRNHVL